MLWLRPLLLTLELMSLSVAVAVAIGVTLAFALSLLRRENRLQAAVFWVCVIGIVGTLATPMVMHAAAWESTAGKFGWMSLTQTSARTYSGFAGRYSGMFACVWIHGLFGTAIVALATLYGTARIERAVIDLARCDGGPVWGWWRVRLPIARNWMVFSALATAVLAASEMTVVDLYGVRTVADEFYLFHAADPSWFSVFMVLVVPALIGVTLTAVAILRLFQPVNARIIDRGLKTSSEAEEAVGGFWQGLASLFALGVTTLMFAFPLLGVIVKAGQQTMVVNDGGQSVVRVIWSVRRTTTVLVRALQEFSGEYQTTLLLASCTAVLSALIAFLATSIAVERPRLRVYLDGLSVGCFLMPGPLVGLAIVRIFSVPLPGVSSLYQQSLVPTMIALSFRALPVAYWVMRVAFSGIDAAVMDSAKMDLKWRTRLWTIERPLIGRALGIAVTASAIVASGEVPSSLPVIPPGVVTVGTRLFGLLHSGARYQEASLAFWYLLFVVVAAVVLVRFVGGDGSAAIGSDRSNDVD
ncbi:hypothetical protein U8335_04505 [Roseiconus lacunae]|uniref:ABC transporter permease n=1 Tax=Roseiconus lacunae TaxID=2605694 RepID=UPI00308F6EE9|nr:hypothetical protein U8335_04505 [Stieleria sp. HD01]